MKDEREFLLAKEAEILPEDLTLAFLIGKYRCNMDNMMRFT
jgi:hypothetical protein